MALRACCRVSPRHLIETARNERETPYPLARAGLLLCDLLIKLMRNERDTPYSQHALNVTDAVVKNVKPLHSLAPIVG